MSEVLRTFVTDTLAAAAQDILAAVERTAAGYEEEIRRLRRLLEPQVRVCRAGVKRSRSLGPAEEEEGEDEEDEAPERPEKQEDPTNQTPSRPRPPRGRGKKRKPGRPQISETQTHVDLGIRILEDSQTEVLSNNILKKSPMLRLKCPRGLREPDFLDLLRSTFPQLSGDDTLFDILTSDKRRRLQPVNLKTLTPEEIHRNISCTVWGKPTLCIRLKTQKEPQEEIRPLQTKDNTGDCLSTSAMLTCDETSSPVQEVEGSSSTSQQLDVQTEEADEHRGTSEPAEDSVICSAAESKGDDTEKGEGRGDANDSDADWKPDNSDEELKESDSELKATKKHKARHPGVKVSETKPEDKVVAVLSCKVCGALHKSEDTFVKHAWSHVDDPGSACGVCGDLSESVEALKDHLQCRHKADDCHVCGESFLSILSLDEHVAAHSGERPYECDVCHDAFALKVSLEDHQKLHKLHKCYTCNKVFALTEQLKAHRRTHVNKKTYLCGVCGKSLSDYRSLSRHKMTHSEKRPHSCQVCGRRFKLPGTLRQHEKIHTDRERSYLCDVCCKMFLTSKQLQIHMRTHTNEKPYHCGECGKGFTTKGPLTIHMRVHTGETPYRCPDCGWSFKRKINLDNHVTVHSGIKPFVCGICGKACARKTYLTVHMRTHNGERPYKCSFCDKAFTQSHCLKTHMKSHLVAEAAT